MHVDSILLCQPKYITTQVPNLSLLYSFDESVVQSGPPHAHMSVRFCPPKCYNPTLPISFDESVVLFCLVLHMPICQNGSAHQNITIQQLSLLVLTSRWSCLIEILLVPITSCCFSSFPYSAYQFSTQFNSLLRRVEYKTKPGYRFMKQREQLQQSSTTTHVQNYSDTTGLMKTHFAFEKFIKPKRKLED